MPQRFKSVYFADHPAPSPTGRHLKLAFGTRDADLFEATRRLSGQDLRELLGYGSYADLRVAADAAGDTLNGFCLKILRDRLPPEGWYGVGGGRGGRAAPRFSEVQATFRGGESEPLHRWYPYLEGYSPRYVEEILRRYAPAAASVLDPFGGTGTTPLTAGREGRDAYYAEINPLLQALTQVKIDILGTPPRRRIALSGALEQAAATFAQRLEATAPAEDLFATYRATFGASAFFDPATLVAVARARALVDELACREPFPAALVQVAVLASLVPSSLLTRAGDLRFKTERELARERVDFVVAVRAHLELMAADLWRLGDVLFDRAPRLVVEDAKLLCKLPPLGVDAVVTSPPYLNGTNYFRNTKLELWFLRSLRSPDDLAEFRARAITAGINDVSSRRQLREGHPLVRSLVERLSRDAYDARIPKMVHSYFQDMTAALDGVISHLNPGATVAIDIGDSAYGGVHIPTDRLLGELLRERGLRLHDEVPLRRRLSRGGRVLRQVLLVFRARSGRAAPRGGATGVDPAGGAPRWERWEAFKRELPHQAEPFARRNWGHPLHSLCSYQGKMKPALAAHLVDSLVPPGGTLLDPFAGVGTIPFEAALAGRRSVGFDISPAAVAIARAKLGRPEADRCYAVLDRLEDALETESVSPEEDEAARALGFNGRLGDYFEAATLREVLIARRFFRVNPPADASEALVMASLLHILHGNRPYALSRRSHPVTPFAPTGAFEYRPLLPRLAEKVARGLEAGRPPSFVDGAVYFQDATLWWPREVGELDAVVTSPPFFDSTRFYLANWMRLWFSGWSADDFQTRPHAFVDERQKRDFRVYEPVFRQARERLKPGGALVLHLGKSRKCDMADELARVAAPWFRVADRFAESVTHLESHGIRDKGTVVEHQYLVLV